MTESPPTEEITAVVADRYRIEGLLGHGGMADVVRATDLVLERPVAMKLLREATETEGDLERFLNETRTLARLSHPGLVMVLDGGSTSADRPYLVMELVDGPSLSDSLDAPLEPTRVAEIGAQVAAALAYAHTQGVVHRDVKPGNVLLRSDGRVKLADFGIAKLLGDQTRHTRTGTVVGSVHYLAPEQVAFEEITPAVDVYALGLMLLRAVTGRHAFEGTTVETALARLSADPQIPDDLPSGWRNLLKEMTAREPGDRPSAADVAGRLSWLAGARTTSRVLPPPPPNRTADRSTAPVHLVRQHAQGARRRLASAMSGISLSPVALGAVLLAVALFVTAGLASDQAVSDKAPDGPTARAAANPVAEVQPEVQTVASDAGLLEPASDAVLPAAVAQPVAGPHQAAPKRDKGKAHKHKPNKGKGKGGKGKGSKGKPGKGKPGKGR